jgi:serine/threonine protein kinase
MLEGSASTPDLLGPRFRVVRLLGRGGMGAVYEAIQLDLGRRVAVKVLTGKTVDPGSAEGRAALKREAVAAARLGHPNIVAVTEYSEGPPPILVMEYLEGRSLGTLVRQGPLPPARAVFLVMQVLSALAAAHERGIVHRDVKPENVFLTEIPGVATDFVKVLDFGIAKELADDGPSSLPGAVSGTPSYMAPEQVSGSRVDARADIYACGSLLYHLLAGVRPYSHLNGSAEILDAAIKGPPVALELLAPHVPKALAALVERAMERDVSRRTLTATELRGALDRLVREERWADQPKMVGDTRPDFPMLGTNHGDATQQPTLSTSGPFPTVDGPQRFPPQGGTAPFAASLAPAPSPSWQPAGHVPHARPLHAPPSIPSYGSQAGGFQAGPASGFAPYGQAHGFGPTTTGPSHARGTTSTPARTVGALVAGVVLSGLAFLAYLMLPLLSPRFTGLPRTDAALTISGCHGDLRENVTVVGSETITVTSNTMTLSIKKPDKGLPRDGRITLSTKARIEDGTTVTLTVLTGQAITYSNLDAATAIASVSNPSAHDPVGGTIVVRSWEADKGKFDLQLSHVVLVDPQSPQQCKLDGRLRL